MTEKFEIPDPASRFTKIPNVLIDRISELDKSEFCIMCYIYRLTIGYNRAVAPLSLKVLTKGRGKIKGTRYAEATVSKSLNSLIHKDLLYCFQDRRDIGNVRTYYIPKFKSGFLSSGIVDERMVRLLLQCSFVTVKKRERDGSFERHFEKLPVEIRLKLIELLDEFEDFKTD